MFFNGWLPLQILGVLKGWLACQNFKRQKYKMKREISLLMDARLVPEPWKWVAKKLLAKLFIEESKNSTYWGIILQYEPIVHCAVGCQKAVGKTLQPKAHLVHIFCLHPEAHLVYIFSYHI